MSRASISARFVWAVCKALAIMLFVLVVSYNAQLSDTTTYHGDDCRTSNWFHCGGK